MERVKLLVIGLGIAAALRALPGVRPDRRQVRPQRSSENEPAAGDFTLWYIQVTSMCDRRAQIRRKGR